MGTPAYVLVTPVRDEVQSVPHTVTSVVQQSLRPREWVIVSDGSTDGTEEVVEAAARTYGWIRLIRRRRGGRRSFARVVQSTMAGIRALGCDGYGYVGLLDADVRFESDYFERLVERFEANPRLGLAGGVVIDHGQPKNQVPRNLAEVPGAVQFFRRSCFESLGGLVAVPEGGWDGVACAMARMNGFETQLFPDLVVDHLKPRNHATGGTLKRLWLMGMRDYAAGYDPLFELLKCASRATERPILLSAFVWWFGYCARAVQRRQRVVPFEVVTYIRQEQRKRLRDLVRYRSDRARPTWAGSWRE